jgi:hypothetical protein
MVQRLVHAPDVAGSKTGGHRFHAFAFAGQQ